MAAATGVNMILGVNGWIWVTATSFPTASPEEPADSASTPQQKYTAQQREAVARAAASIKVPLCLGFEGLGFRISPPPYFLEDHVRLEFSQHELSPGNGYLKATTANNDGLETLYRLCPISGRPCHEQNFAV